MKKIAFVLISLASAISSASESKKLSMYCQGQIFHVGSWQSGETVERTLVLQKDPNYPNYNDPRDFWNGVYTEELLGARVTIKIKYSEWGGKYGEFNNTVTISRNGISAESEGGSHIRASFRFENEENSVGILCHSMEFK